MNADGTITVAAGTTAGSYSYDYTICEVLNPTNCATVTATVVVGAASLTAVADTPAAQSGFTGGTTPESVLDNDTLNGVAVVPADVTLTPGTAPSPTAGSITMNADGTITVAPGTTAGTYSYDYTICEVLNPTNCDTAIVTVTVSLDPLQAISAELTSILEEDLATTISNQSRGFSALSGDALDRLIDSRGRQCAAAVQEILDEDDLKFATASATILSQSAPVLNKIFTALSNCPDIRFEIAGHTDSRGSEDYNISLSQARVASVKAALVGRGIRSDRLVGSGYGERRPIADNDTEEGRAVNRRVEFLALNAIEKSTVTRDRCGTIRAFDVDGGLEFGESGLNTAGTFGEENFDCGTSERRITRGEFTLTQNDDLGTQGMLSFTIARERQIGFDRLNGRFWGGYLSRTSVEGNADGHINGVGINAGVYSAQALDNGLYSNYYAAGSLGVHSFDLTFRPSIVADGSYVYGGLFAGAGLGGVITRDRMEIRPRIGFDLGVGVASDADVTASGLGATASGALEIDPVIGVRGYVEATFQSRLEERYSTDRLASESFAITPRLFCDSVFDDADAECGLGGRIEFSRLDPDRAIDWQFNLDAEATRTKRSMSIGIARERRILKGLGAITTQIAGGEAGDVEISHFLNLRW